MKTLEYTKQTGELKTFFLQNEIQNMINVPYNKPSSRPIRTKKGKKAIAALIDMEKNKNHSWYAEIKKKSQKDSNAVALFYRGKKITFYEMIKKSDELAKSLVSIGIKKGDEIPCCMANIPELVYLLLASNKIGAKLNIFGSNYNKKYLEEILSKCSDKVIFVSDNYYNDLKQLINKNNFKNKVVISLADSLPRNLSECDEYEPMLDKYYHYNNYLSAIKETDKMVISYDELILKSYKKKIEVIDNNDLNTEFLITYTSGSTINGYPSPIVHTNRSLITSGRFHDSELSGNPELKGLRGLAHIHSDSNTDIITCISDNLMQLWSVALEPEYDKNKALDYLFINKPNYANMPTSFYIQIAKDYLIEKKYHENGIGRKMPFLLAAFAVGEGTSKGEEKFINKFLRESRAGSGVKIMGFSFPFTTLCIGGGDCEHGGIYYSLWRTMMEKINFAKLRGIEYGMMPESFSQVTALKQNIYGEWEECNYNELGLIVANSCTNLKKYENNKEKTLSLIIRDNLGRDWISSKVYGFIDNLGGVHVKGRMGQEFKYTNNQTIPNFALEDLVCLDTKNVLSCSFSVSEIDEKKYPILNIELQPNKENNIKKIIFSIKKRCEKRFGKEITENLNFRIIDSINSFPLNNSGKRSINKLSNLSIENVYRLSDFSKLTYSLDKEKKLLLRN